MLKNQGWRDLVEKEKAGGRPLFHRVEDVIRDIPIWNLVQEKPLMNILIKIWMLLEVNIQCEPAMCERLLDTLPALLNI